MRINHPIQLFFRIINSLHQVKTFHGQFRGFRACGPLIRLTPGIFFEDSKTYSLSVKLIPTGIFSAVIFRKQGL